VCQYVCTVVVGRHYEYGRLLEKSSKDRIYIRIEQLGISLQEWGVVGSQPHKTNIDEDSQHLRVELH